MNREMRTMREEELSEGMRRERKGNKVAYQRHPGKKRQAAPRAFSASMCCVRQIEIVMDLPEAKSEAAALRPAEGLPIHERGAGETCRRQQEARRHRVTGHPSLLDSPLAAGSQGLSYRIAS